MSAGSPSRVQLVVSGKFLALLLIAAGLLGGGYYWYNRQQETQKRFHTPPYFVNRSQAIFRPCNHCLKFGDLKPQSDWEIGAPSEIPATEQRWFLAVEDPPAPVKVSGVLMLPVYAAFREDPFFGFDQTSMILVPYQNLQRMPWMEHPQPVPPPAEVPPIGPTLTPPPSVSSSESRPVFLGDWINEDPETRGVTKFSIVNEQGKLLVHAWGRCFPRDCDWNQTPAVDTDESLFVVWNLASSVRHWELSFDSAHRLKLSDDGQLSYFVRQTEGQQ
jgi:hypothetical protein